MNEFRDSVFEEEIKVSWVHTSWSKPKMTAVFIIKKKKKKEISAQKLTEDRVLNRHREMTIVHLQARERLQNETSSADTLILNS